MTGREGTDAFTVAARCRGCGSTFPDHDWDSCYVFVPEDAPDEALHRALPEDPA